MSLAFHVRLIVGFPVSRDPVIPFAAGQATARLFEAAGYRVHFSPIQLAGHALSGTGHTVAPALRAVLQPASVTPARIPPQGADIRASARLWVLRRGSRSKHSAFLAYVEVEIYDITCIAGCLTGRLIDRIDLLIQQEHSI
jgi:hypothetical protein